MIALKPLLAEQEPRELLHPVPEARARRRPCPQTGGQGIELCNGGLRIQIRIADTGYLQGAAIELKVRFVLLRQILETLHVHGRENLDRAR